jgi:hypothetical protein
MDTSWLMVTENKENAADSATSVTKTVTSYGKATATTRLASEATALNNLSLNSYGILATLNTSAAAGGNISNRNNDDAVSLSDSIDHDQLKFDVYEKQIQKLAYENQQLRKRVKNLKELARTKEEQLIENFQSACEDKVKSEEKTQIEYK